MAGYDGYSKSNNALVAESEGAQLGRPKRKRNNAMTKFRQAVRDGGTITENRWAGSAWVGDRDITSWARAASAVTLRRYVREAKLHGVDTEIHVAKGDHWIDFATDQAVS